MSDSWRDRVNTEQLELTQRIKRLTPFIESEQFQALPDKQQHLLREQLQHMLGYERVLLARLEMTCAE